jgi:membrane protein implicated in regulation of membrane protease activity
MSLVYLASLIVALGVLVLQIAFGGKGDVDGHADAAGAHDLAADHPDDFNLSNLLASTRFWIFALLAFGLSGSLLALFALAGPIAIFLLALGAGIASGALAAYSLRALRRGSTSTSVHAREAVGRTGRLLVACGKGRVGQVRVTLKGQSVDLVAATDEAEIARGEQVLVDDVDGDVAHVSRSPREIV